MLEKISQALSIRLPALARAYEARRAGAARRQTRRGSADRATREPPAGDAVDGADLRAQKGLLAMLLAGGEAARRVREEMRPDDFSDPTVRLAVETIVRTSAGSDSVDVAALISGVDDPEAATLLSELAVVDPPDRDGGRLCGDYIRVVRRSQLEGEIRAVDREIQTAELSDDEEALLLHVARRQELANRLKELSADQ
jgi:hypothetical protein